jgi:hypothetical protein
MLSHMFLFFLAPTLQSVSSSSMLMYSIENKIISRSFVLEDGGDIANVENFRVELGSLDLIQKKKKCLHQIFTSNIGMEYLIGISHRVSSFVLFEILQNKIQLVHSPWGSLLDLLAQLSLVFFKVFLYGLIDTVV